jgi:SOS-response transcriptional repressor LexA
VLYGTQTVLSFLREYQRQHGYGPTWHEMQTATGLAIKTLQGIIEYLAGQQFLAHKPHYPRGLYLPDEPNQFKEVRHG